MVLKSSRKRSKGRERKTSFVLAPRRYYNVLILFGRKRRNYLCQTRWIIQFEKKKKLVRHVLSSVCNEKASNETMKHTEAATNKERNRNKDGASMGNDLTTESLLSENI
ncbi:hypothetical protein NE237_007688 [Protea cynaroides]|uniref:Uncharacterized protein n=1 Tax=Protea cynaroides TaxID=273540 RepID=A0A9Q0KQN1_9MAGN|nr:hypothetical protein NE237_007688 [Protea cynaroides]